MFYYLRFLLPVNIDRTPCPILRSKPSLVVGMPVLRATFVFKPLIPTARFSENDNPFMFVKFIFIFQPAKVLLFCDIFIVLFGPFARKLSSLAHQNVVFMVVTRIFLFFPQDALLLASVGNPNNLYLVGPNCIFVCVCRFFVVLLPLFSMV